MTSTGARPADLPAQREDELRPRGRVVVMARDGDVRTKTARGLRRRYDRDYVVVECESPEQLDTGAATSEALPVALLLVG